MAIFHILIKLNYLSTSTLCVSTSVLWVGWATVYAASRVDKLKTRVGKGEIFPALGAEVPNKCLPTLA